MSDRVLAPIDAEHATNLLRHVEPAEALEAGILTPMAGTRAVRLYSLDEAERFLVSYDGSAVALGGAMAKINYVDPAHLAHWVGDVLGDLELSAALQELADTRKPFGYLVPDMKSLIAARIEESKHVLDVALVAAK